ncbi:glycosyl hydrolase [Streptomyces sp. 3MP-14]|uniref:Glycosyl hydrolase n=1 Tax=Streptomyces mimosae TaxID=2586635 RepID=A0A5N6AG90_9ACTN|nr:MULTISPECIES: discoidin domain-containing protein [Streptomyces]KAB8167734.1 glycosyl hydrolase [Streptomyces mimosae]KAB8177619.1 glycosyl hydrolase [Streptomyces sp. 3MP-14]
MRPGARTGTRPGTRRRPARRRAGVAALTAALIAGGLTAGTAAGQEAGHAAGLAAGAPATASSVGEAGPAGLVTDGDHDTYWESAAGDLPAWVATDLGEVHRIESVELSLPADWDARDQTLAVEGSMDGQSFTALSATATHTFDPSDDNRVTIPLPEVRTRFVRVEITANSAAETAQLSELTVRRAEESRENLAASATFTASSEAGDRPAALAGDGATDSYWQSEAGELPQWLQADLGASVPVNRVVLGLPADFEARTQTLTLLASQDGAEFTELTPAEDALFDADAAENTVTLAFDSTTARYLRVSVTGNTAEEAAQLGELEIYGPAGGDTQAPSAPMELTAAAPIPGRVALSWAAAEDDHGIAGYEILADGVSRTTVEGDVTSFTDTQPADADVEYTVRAIDAAGNRSADSDPARYEGELDAQAIELAEGKPISASSFVHTFVASNANDGDLATYWEGASGAYPSQLTVELGAEAELDSLVVALNTDSAWGARTQRIEVLGRAQGSDEFTSLVGAADYAFAPGSGNAVTIPVSGQAADVRLAFTDNTGAPNGQVAELQVYGEPAPNPDLEVVALTAQPPAPLESEPLTLTATVRNGGSEASPATEVAFAVDGDEAATAEVGALEPGETAEVAGDVGVHPAGSYPVSAVVDPENTVVEQDEDNNAYEAPEPVVVEPVPSADLVVERVSWEPATPQAGDEVTFSARLANRGSLDTAADAHEITLNLSGPGGQVATLSGTFNGVIAAGDVTSPVQLGSWEAADGSFTLATTVGADEAEIPAKRQNNTDTRAFSVGRGAQMPYALYEAEDAEVGGGAQVVGPNRDVGDLAGEASGRRAVTLESTGEYVEFTTAQSTNTLVTRFSIPDSAGGGGIDSTLNVYVDGEQAGVLELTSRYAWLYGNEAQPGNSPGMGGPRHIYDEAHLLLDRTVPAGSTIRLQKDAANDTEYAIDFISLEQVAPRANPDQAAYTEPEGFSHQDVQDALDRVRMDTTGTLVGVYLPPGDYETSNKFQVYGGAVEVLGAGVWYTRFHAPQGQTETDIGFRADSTASGSTFAHFTYLGNYTTRIDGPGKVFDFSNVTDMVIDDIWTEHMVCLYWGANTDRVTISNSRMRNLFADGLNMTNGSTDNHVVNNETRATGDDSFALFSAIDAGGADETGNLYENLTSLLTWRAAGLAVYGGYDNTFRNIRIADTLVYSGITISSLDFGYPMNGFGEIPTNFENITIERAGGHFWGDQVFPGIWLFSASEVFQGIRVTDVDIIDPTYVGIMFQTNYVGGQPEHPVTDTVLTNVTISGAQRSGDAYDHKSGIGVWANEMPEAGQGPAVGEATFHNLVLNDNAEDFRNTTSTFTFHLDP